MKRLLHKAGFIQCGASAMRWVAVALRQGELRQASDRKHGRRYLSLELGRYTPITLTPIPPQTQCTSHFHVHLQRRCRLEVKHWSTWEKSIFLASKPLATVAFLSRYSSVAAGHRRSPDFWSQRCRTAEYKLGLTQTLVLGVKCYGKTITGTFGNMLWGNITGNFGNMIQKQHHRYHG